MTNFLVIGVYKIVPTQKSIIEAARYHNFIHHAEKYSDQVYWEDFKNLSLIEIRVDGPCSPKQLVRSITQKIEADPQDNQVPWLEYYLDDAGEKLLPREKVAKAKAWRLCFFLHFVNIAVPLKIGHEYLPLPRMTRLPRRLQPFTHFVPVD